jgi:hypothetical protein
MKKSLALLIGIIWVTVPAFGQIESPYEYLDEYAASFTPHHKVMAYAHYLAKNSERVRLYEYGESYEGRPLIYLAFSEAENIEKLDSIRLHHLRHLGKERGTFNKTYSRAIVWLSHGVHGNEAGATESALLNMYQLASGRSDIVDNLEKTVVIIDPCLNPDGFDRYVQFYRSQKGANPNANPYSVEHHEPWPAGRVNHYQFDLNRDWAWQTQIETRQRMEVFFEWMPHIHVDIHEQFPENPYYFAPAAKPFHKAIEDWQIKLQTHIGKNNAHYFDQNAWPYFTGEVFDLFYPSYGDTYPILNGAIGMTYEQAGHGIAGLAYALDNGDTLRLIDRIKHHNTTAMATIESANRLKDSLVDLQANYFNNYEVGDTKAYVYKTDNDALSLRRSLIDLLKRNNIEFQYISTESDGMNVELLDFGKGEKQSHRLHAGDLYISADQFSARLLDVLTETSPVLEDTLTYDITSWSIALAYGDLYRLQKDIPPLELTNRELPDRISDRMKADSNYAAILRFKDEYDYEMMAALFKKGYNLRLATEGFKMNGRPAVPMGSIVILKADNKNNYDQLFTISRQMEGHLDFVGTGWTEEGPDLGSDAFQLMEAPKLALLKNDALDVNGFGFAWHFLDRELEYPYDVLSKDHLLRQLSQYNTVLIPDGRISFSEKEMVVWSDWISEGGRLILLGTSATAFADKAPYSLEYKTAKADSVKEKEQENEYASHNPGAVVRMNWDQQHPLGYHMDNTYYSLKTSALVYQPLKNGAIGTIDDELKVYGFMGENIRNSLTNSMSFGLESHGQGKLIYLLDDPLYRGFWKRGHQIVWNALFFAQ